MAGDFGNVCMNAHDLVWLSEPSDGAFINIHDNSLQACDSMGSGFLDGKSEAGRLKPQAGGHR